MRRMATGGRKRAREDNDRKGVVIPPVAFTLTFYASLQMQIYVCIHAHVHTKEVTDLGARLSAVDIAIQGGDQHVSPRPPRKSWKLSLHVSEKRFAVLFYFQYRSLLIEVMACTRTGSITGEQSGDTCNPHPGRDCQLQGEDSEDHL